MTRAIHNRQAEAAKVIMYVHNTPSSGKHSWHRVCQPPGRIIDYVLGMSSTALMDELHIYYTSLTVETVCQRWSRMIKADKVPGGGRFIMPTESMVSALKLVTHRYLIITYIIVHYKSV